MNDWAEFFEFGIMKVMPTLYWLMNKNTFRAELDDWTVLCGYINADYRDMGPRVKMKFMSRVQHAVFSLMHDGILYKDKRGRVWRSFVFLSPMITNSHNDHITLGLVLSLQDFISTVRDLIGNPPKYINGVWLRGE